MGNKSAREGMAETAFLGTKRSVTIGVDFIRNDRIRSHPPEEILTRKSFEVFPSDFEGTEICL